MKTKQKPPLSARKALLRQKIVKSPYADDLSVLEFSRLLMALDTARTHGALDEVKRYWKEFTQSKGE
jgi:hypothetical protein